MSQVKCLKLNKAIRQSSPTKTGQALQAFTLLELLLVIAIISVLAGLVIFNLRPADIFKSTKGVETARNIRQIEDAIKAYALDHDGNYPSAFGSLASGTYDLCLAGQSGCTANSIDLQELVTAGYLSEIPKISDCTSPVKTCLQITYNSINYKIVLALEPPITYAAQVLDQVGPDYLASQVNPDPAQSFTAGLSGLLKQIDIYMGSGTFTLNLYEGAGIGGTLLHTQQVSGPSSWGVGQFVLSTPVSVTKGLTYTFQLVGSVNIRGSSGDLYSGGQFYPNQWTTFTDMVFNTYVSTQLPALTPTPNPIYFGTGVDGAVTIASNKNINTDIIATGRTCADGINFSVTALTSNNATLSTTPAAGCLAANDTILLINLQGNSTNYVNVGNYELLTVQSASGTNVTFTGNKTKYYGDGVSDDLNIGTATTNQRIMLQRVPNYSNVKVNNVTSLTANIWDGTKGGVLAFRVSDTLTVDGSITMTGKGYRGGPKNPGNWGYGYSGESYNGLGIEGGINNLGGGGPGNNAVNWPYNVHAGGGGYGTVGQWGTKNGNRNPGGDVYGEAILEGKIYSGSGGGGSLSVVGSNGGGIILINSNLIYINGNIISSGNNGTCNNQTTSNCGGGGSGGSIRIIAFSTYLYSSKVTAIYGLGVGEGSWAWRDHSGDGGYGRISISYINSNSGSTLPAAFTQDI